LVKLGYLQGEISSVDGILAAGENADVRAEVKSKTVIVKGKVHGNITVQERCELHSHSQLIGDLKAARLVIEEGSTFVGKSEVTPNKNIIKRFGCSTSAERRAAESRFSTLRSSECLLKDGSKHNVLIAVNIQLEPELVKSTYCTKSTKMQYSFSAITRNPSALDRTSLICTWQLILASQKT
jgi:cytoskeletal protein CcmA (bactofilin family)